MVANTIITPLACYHFSPRSGKSPRPVSLCPFPNPIKFSCLRAITLNISVREAESSLKLELKLNGETKQNSSTAQMIFPVAALIEFISSMVTLEPGDIISTGTPSGVGHTSGTFLKPGDTMHGFIEKIGTLETKIDKELDCPYESEIVFSRREDR
ncbi:hypothetical protein EBX93_07250 [bacterium]|nr:hypothetical protein [bacterium]